MILDDNFIPVDDTMEKFENHLLSHDRVILSAKFGDGKTFFLNQFKEKCKKDKKSPFEFITLYPVNYQVLPNNDIFNLIKHDVLLQMLQLKMIDVNYEVTDKMAAEFYIQSHFGSVAETFISMLSAVEANDAVSKAVITGLRVGKLFKSLRNKIDKYKEEIDQTSFLDKYLSSFDDNSVYENDVVTKIIRDNIETYQKVNKKRIVLVIEDMDRLDPAHLFRILNVFTAQMDYGYRCFVPNVNDSLVGNKFGVSNVVFVMHEGNTKAIFHHFYGEDADYKGYMSKFYNKDIFTFSLAEEKEKYALSLISQEIDIREDTVKTYFSKDFWKDITLRDIRFAVDKVAEQFQSIEVKKGVNANPLLLKLFVIAKRLGVSNDLIILIVTLKFRKCDHFYVDRLLPLIAQNPRTKVLEQIYVNTRKDEGFFITVNGISEDGLCSPSQLKVIGDYGDDKKLKQRCAYMLSLLGY